jgi:basic amino acid/polyamine antiporter, APA family
MPPATASATPVSLARRLGLFDATMIVMGGIVGSGIFMNPYVVAQRVHTPFLILGAWIFGGIVALAGGFIYAELASLRPDLNGQYAYLREAYHPAVGFSYGWGLLCVIQTGGMAAVAVTCAHYASEITSIPLSDRAMAILILLFLTFVNCLGVRLGSSLQSVLMILKIGAIFALVFAGFYFGHGVKLHLAPLIDEPASLSLLESIGASLTPVLFAYGGWQCASFMTSELRDPRRDLSRAMVLGVLGVITLYLAVNVVCLNALGPEGLAHTSAPASAVMQQALGERGAFWIAVAIAVSTLGFLSHGMLTAPRVYYSMAKDGLFFSSVGWISPRSQAPVVAIILQGILASVIALTGKYDQILNYVVSIDFIFFGLTATTLFVFRRRNVAGQSYSTPGHPFTTIFFVIACWLVVLATFIHDPRNSFIGLGFLILGIPAFFFWQRRRPV